MSATTAAVNPVQPAPPPARPAAGPAAGAEQGRFDRHLDAARQRHGEGRDQPDREDTHEAVPDQAAAKADVDPHKPAKAEAAANDQGNPDAAALAAAMLALIGQAAPAKPLAAAGMLAHASGKAVTAGAGAEAKAPAALVLLANTAATAAAGMPAINVDASALAPMLAKPAEQKDAPLDIAQLGSLSATPLPLTDPGTAVAPAHNLAVASPAGTPAFAQELGQHVVWLGQQDIKQARIRLHPEDLGAVDVKVSMNHDRVDVSFAVQHPAAVHALQQTLPQLDALLAQHGLALGQADVGQRQQQGKNGRAGDTGGASAEINGEPAPMAATPVASLGILDTFA